jgi:nucleobase:cation symporter-1, NCS1 family
MKGDRPYYFQGGFNVAAMVALPARVLPVVPGFLQTAGVFVTVYNNAWFVSFFIAGATYCLLCRPSGGAPAKQK